MQNIKPIGGWSLDYIVALDLHRPGTAGDFLRASDERRQVIAALLSTKPIPSDPLEAADLAAFTSKGGHREMLTAACETLPAGLRGALARSGPHSRHKENEGWPFRIQLLRRLLPHREKHPVCRLVQL